MKLRLLRWLCDVTFELGWTGAHAWACDRYWHAGIMQWRK